MSELTRLHPAPLPPSQRELTVFSLLLLGQRFSSSGEFVAKARDAWLGMTEISPLRHLRGEVGPGKYAIEVYIDDGLAPSIDLGIEQGGVGGKVLSIPAANKNRLSDYLNMRQLHTEEGDVAAGTVWTKDGHAGVGGSLVAVLVSGNAEGELYELGAAQDYPVPVVGVVTSGPYWPLLLSRALAQLMGDLRDEFELAGDDYGALPPTLTPPSATPKNVLYISDAQRARLIAGEDPRQVVGRLPRHWPVNTQTALDFYPHPGDAPNPSQPPQNESVQLVEGGDGYRRNVLRCNFDCLMRRMPGSTSQPVQQPMNFCAVCWQVLYSAIRLNSAFRLSEARGSTLPTQRLRFDSPEAKWQKVDPVDLSSLPYSQRLDQQGNVGPLWSCQLEVNKQDGLKITDVKLRNRPGDPFKLAEDVLERLTFTPLSITFGNEQPTPLLIADAFANTLAPPKLELAAADVSVPPKGTAKLGAKLTLHWDLQHTNNNCAVEVVMSVVFKGPATNFDPGGVIEACKFFPQVSMRYLRPPKGSPNKAEVPANVTALSGTVSYVANNSVPIALRGQLDPDLQDMATGQQTVGLYTDSNSSDWDNVYDFSPAELAAFARYVGVSIGDLIGVLRLQGVELAELPDFGLKQATWKKGRKLAGVRESFLNVFSASRFALSVAGATARFAHLNRGAPGLIHWSWLFDYALPILPFDGQPKRFVAAYHSDEPTVRGDDANHPREIEVKWPRAEDQTSQPLCDYTLTVLKLPRQGAYDNVHIVTNMGADSHLRDLAAAPACGDVCLHLHFRWGQAALEGGNPSLLSDLLGWGDGSYDQGAGTTRGTPLIPPNQHVDVEVERLTLGTTRVSYIAVVHRPAIKKRQVILEQGLALGYAYSGLDPGDGIALAAAVGAIEISASDTVVGLKETILKKQDELRQALLIDRAIYDRMVRMYFRGIYERIGWYDSEIDEVKGDVRQAPGTELGDDLTKLEES